MRTTENYVPTEQEIQKAEDMMDKDQWAQTLLREKIFKPIEQAKNLKEYRFGGHYAPQSSKEKAIAEDLDLRYAAMASFLSKYVNDVKETKGNVLFRAKTQYGEDGDGAGVYLWRADELSDKVIDKFVKQLQGDEDSGEALCDFAPIEDPKSLDELKYAVTALREYHETYGGFIDDIESIINEKLPAVAKEKMLCNLNTDSLNEIFSYGSRYSNHFSYKADHACCDRPPFGNYYYDGEKSKDDMRREYWNITHMIDKKNNAAIYFMDGGALVCSRRFDTHGYCQKFERLISTEELDTILRNSISRLNKEIAASNRVFSKLNNKK